MNINVVKGSITEIASDALIVNLFEGVKSPGGATSAADSALGGLISELIASGEITGKWLNMTLIHTQNRIPAKRVLVVGLGKSTEFDLSAVRKVSGAAVRFLRDKGVKSVSSIVHGAGIGGLNAKLAAQAVVEGMLIGLHRADLYKTSNEAKNPIDSFTIVEHSETRMSEIEAGVREGRITADATNYARTLTNQPPSIITPIALAQQAREVAERTGLDLEILEEGQLANMGANGILAVAKGSCQPARMIVLRYNGGAGKPTLALVGKGVTFDSGGLDIKSNDSMYEMKDDMAGGAAVIGAMRIVSELLPSINVIGIIPAVENMLSGGAYKPGDVITYANGKTVEVTSTDAEGRLALADAIMYAVRQGANYIVDIATLTGATNVAVGNGYSSVMGNNAELMARLKESSSVSGERVWELPLPADYMYLLKSSIADMTNGGPRPAGAIQGGLFLQEFTDGVPWVHMDIGATANLTKFFSPDLDKYMDAGGTGVGVRTLAILAQGLAG